MRASLIFITMMLIASVSMAQHKMDPEMLEVIKTKKIAFITEKVGLTPQEAEKFWPIYNQLEKDRYNIMEQKRKIEQSFETKTPVKSEAECRKLANEFAAIHVREGKLIEEYNTKLLSILPAEKVMKLYLSEGKFRSFLMNEFRKNNQREGDRR